MIVFAHRRCIAFDKDLKAQRPNDDRRLTIKSRTGWKLYTKKHLSSGHSLFVRRQASKQIKKKLRITSLLLTFISFSMLLMPLVVEIFYENCDLRFREHDCHDVVCLLFFLISTKSFHVERCFIFTIVANEIKVCGYEKHASFILNIWWGVDGAIRQSLHASVLSSPF